MAHKMVVGSVQSMVGKTVVGLVQLIAHEMVVGSVQSMGCETDVNLEHLTVHKKALLMISLMGPILRLSMMRMTRARAMVL